MSEKVFLLQGLTSATHLAALQALLSPTDLEKAILSVAYVTHAGVRLIQDELRHAGDRVDAYVGIRNDITSKEALLALLETGVNLHYVDTGARTLVFHPKVYLGCRQNQAKVIVGSANLTEGGIHNNIESSLVLDLDLSDVGDRTFVDSIIDEFRELIVNYPRHVVRLRNQTEIELLHQSGRLVSEASSSPPSTVSRHSNKTDDLPRMSLAVDPRRSVLHSVLSKKSRNLAQSSGVKVENEAAIPDLAIVWQSKPLTERDLGIPSGKNTHATGSINLDKGMLPQSVDHRHYFRDEVFKTLDWHRTDRHSVYESYATFGLIVKGVDLGEYRARIAHSANTESVSYQQHNAMTRISWGDMTTHIANHGLIGRIFTLYKDESHVSRFIIEID